MFCKNCGKDIGDAKFCQYCGNPNDSNPNVTVTLIQNDLFASIKDKLFKLPKKKTFVTVAALVLAIMTVFLCIKTSNVNSSPEKVAATLIKSEYELEAMTVLKCFPDFLIKEIAVEEGLPKNTSRSKLAEKLSADTRYHTPKNVKIVNAEIIEEYDISEYDIYEDEFDYMTDNDYESISEVAEVSVEFIVDGEEDSFEITCIKMEDKWYVLS